jgi:hypothetical protein
VSGEQISHEVKTDNMLQHSDVCIVVIALAWVILFRTMLCGAVSYSLSIGGDAVKLIGFVEVPARCSIELFIAFFCYRYYQRVPVSNYVQSI